MKNTAAYAVSAKEKFMSYQKAFAMQAIGEYKETDKASALKMRDYKDATDLIREGGGDMKDVSTVKAVVRRLTPL